MQSEPRPILARASAANTPPILSGTYTYVDGTGVATLTLSVGAGTDLAIGDLFVDMSLGASALISAVNTGGATATIKSGLAAIFNGGNFQIHKAPSNLTTAGRTARPLGLSLVTEIDWTGLVGDLTSFVVRPYLWNPLSSKWEAKGDGTVTVDADQDYVTAVRGTAPIRGNAVEGSVYAYNNTTGAVTGMTLEAQRSIADFIPGMTFFDKSSKTSGQILAVDLAGTVYLAPGLTVALMAGVHFGVKPLNADPHLYWYFSTITGTGVAVVESRVLGE